MIATAFADVRLGDGVSLHETVVIDNYGTDAERAAARVDDEREDWQKLVSNPDFATIRWIGGFNFYDAEGLRFHLPAYLTLAVRDFECERCGDVLEGLMFALTSTSVYNHDRFSILTPAQRSCVREVLVYLRRTYELESKELDQAILNQWSTDEAR